MTGSTIKIDKFGDSEGNFSVLALKPYKMTRDNFSCDLHMVPVAYFQQGENFPVSEFFLLVFIIYFLHSLFFPHIFNKTKKYIAQDTIYLGVFLLLYSQEYKILNASVRIDWPGNEKPVDQPICGFNNELCPKDDTHITSLVIAGALGLLLFCSAGR